MTTNPEAFSIEVVGDITVITLTKADKILNNDERIQFIGLKLLELAESRYKILVDCINVSFMSSSFIGKLILLLKNMRSKEGKLVLCGIAPNILEVLKILKVRHKRLSDLFSIFPDRETALSSFQQT